MNAVFNMNWGIVSIFTYALAYGTIAYFAIKLYGKPTIKPSLWKLFIVIIIGMFSFSIEWTMDNRPFNLHYCH